MKGLIILPIILAAASARDDGMYLMECVANSATGAKLADAMYQCNHGNATGDIGMRDDFETCYDFNTTVAYLHSVYADDYCILSNMGWINGNGTGYDWDMWINDINGLPELVTQAVWGRQEQWKQCVADKTNYWSQHPCFNGSKSLYSEEEKGILAQAGVMINQYECFRDNLMGACGDVENQILSQCIANSTTGDEYWNAVGICSADGNSTIATRSLRSHLEDRQHNNMTEQCYDFNTTKEFLMQYYQDDICILGEMGWFLTNGTTGYNITEFINDVNGFPSEVAKGVFAHEQQWNDCVMYWAEQGSQHPCYNGTESLYTDEERDQLAEIGTMIVQYECFKHYFFEVCIDVVGGNSTSNVPM